MSLSRFFTLEELVHSDTARREGIPNEPDAAQIEQLRQLAQAVLDPLREAVGRAIKVTSGYRGPALNRRIGGSARSQHSLGQAADLQAPGMPVVELFKTAIRERLPFDQIIYEAADASTKWVHVSHRAGANRAEIRVAQFDSAGRAVAYPMISEQQALAMTEPTVRSRSAAPEGDTERADEPEGGFAAAPTIEVAAKRVASERAAPKVVAGKRAPVKKAAVKKAKAKKTVPRKATARKTTAKKSAAKKKTALSRP